MPRLEAPPAGAMFAIDPAAWSPGDAVVGGLSARAESLAGHRNMLQLIQLRWLAVLGQLATIVVVSEGLDIRLPLPPMIEVLICLSAFNLASQLRWRERRSVSQRELFIALLVDVAALSAQLYFTGGTSNPFVSLYLLQVILGTVLLESRLSLGLAGVILLCLCVLTLFSQPLAWPETTRQGLDSVYVQGMLLSFALNAGLLVLFMSRIQRNLRLRDERLALLRQRAAEQEHIVRMGLLASGAAHELGTPLATLAVILGDWRRMPTFAQDPELREELAEMQTQVQRCKGIVSGILLSAGETRGEAAGRTTLGAFLDSLVADWRARRPDARLHFDAPADPDMPVAADAALRQMIGNLLDNACEASPAGLHLAVRREDEQLLVLVSDQGPGFAPGILADLGKPYRSTKQRPGSGLGLFLVVNVAHTLGGTVEARNLPGGGAEVRVRLPLEAIALDRSADHER